MDTFPKAHAINADRGDFILEVEPSLSDPDIAQFVKELDYFELQVEFLNDTFVLPYDLTVKILDCGVSNAFYDPTNHEVHMCYEIVRDFMRTAYDLYYYDDDAAHAHILDTIDFVFYHEVGHALIDAYNIPILGREENTADSFAAYVILEYTDSDGQYIVLGAAKQFRAWEEEQSHDYSAIHNLHIQRFYDLACYMYGKDPETSVALSTAYLLPSERRDYCQYDYEKLVRDWDGLLYAWSHQSEGPPVLSLELDQAVYTWSDRVYITLIAPDYNVDSRWIEQIGGTSQLHSINISTAEGGLLQGVALTETGTDTGIFYGEITLTGFAHDADGDPSTGDSAGNDMLGRTVSDTRSSEGQIAAGRNDNITVTLDSVSGDGATASALIRWNVGDVVWVADTYEALERGTVRVVDPDMNLDPGRADAFDVHVHSDTDPDGATLTVTETHDASGIFEARVMFVLTGESSGDQLLVGGGDTVTARYVDHTLPDPFTTGDDLHVENTALIDRVPGYVTTTTPPELAEPDVQERPDPPAADAPVVHSVASNAAFYDLDDTITFSGTTRGTDVSQIITVAVRHPGGSSELHDGISNPDGTFVLSPLVVGDTFDGVGVYTIMAFTSGQDLGTAATMQMEHDGSRISVTRGSVAPTVSSGGSVPDTQTAEPAPGETLTGPHPDFAQYMSQGDSPATYVDRYASDPVYAAWFDENFSSITVWQAVGLVSRDGPHPDFAPHMSQGDDPATYVARYAGDPSYAAWFDASFPDITIRQAVGLVDEDTGVPDPPPAPPPVPQDLPEPESATVEPEPDTAAPVTLECGTGTVLSDGKCVPAAPRASGGCLIATAAHGTEMAESVQSLREVRDSVLLTTASGTAFMSAFNGVYYAFSPTVADWETQSPELRQAVRALIAPMVASMSLMSAVGAGSEAGVIAVGTFVIALNAIMYVGAPVALAVALRKLSRMRRSGLLG